ncbi:MAG: hypothetical protein Q8J87_11770 [Sediminibacterium sp.]|nr:hypothetical protein [Sediminibacterium sp.]
MLDLKEKYIVNSRQQKVGVQLDIKTFKRLEEVLEDYALSQYMKPAEKEVKLCLSEARLAYKRLKKK